MIGRTLTCKRHCLRFMSTYMRLARTRESSRVNKLYNFITCQRCERCVTVMSGTVCVFALVLVAGLMTINSVWSYPIHASCSIDWTFSISCDQVSKAILKQIDTWQSADNCKQGGEKCLYKLASKSPTKIAATHTTPVKHYVDDLTFTLTPTGNGCQVHGHSTSETWYAVLDYGTNYCNLENLITGSGLDKTPGYKEVTSDSVCTQYSSHNCTKY